MGFEAMRQKYGGHETWGLLNLKRMVLCIMFISKYQKCPREEP